MTLSLSKKKKNTSQYHYHLEQITVLKGIKGASFSVQISTYFINTVKCFRSSWWLSGEESATDGSASSGLGQGRSRKRAWQPTLEFLPEKSHGHRSLTGWISQ